MAAVREGAFDPGPAPEPEKPAEQAEEKPTEDLREKCLRRLREQEDSQLSWYAELAGDEHRG